MPDRPDCRVEVVGVPFNSSGSTDGVAGAPAALRAVGLIDGLRATGVDVLDRDDLDLGPTDSARDPKSRLIAPGSLARMIHSVRAEVEAILRAGNFPLVIGGDCPILLGCLRATTPDPPPGLLFVDGHEDAWPPERSTTGEAADMELGFALGLNLGDLPGWLVGELPRLDPRRVLVVGPRDEGELAEAGVPSIGDVVEIIRTDAIEAIGPEAMGADAGRRLAQMGPWWLHVDLDVLATESLGAVDYRQPGGLTWEALTRLTRGALANPEVRGFDVTIYNPDLDPVRGDARRIVRYLVGRSARDDDAPASSTGPRNGRHIADLDAHHVDYPGCPTPGAAGGIDPWKWWWASRSS